MSQNNMITFITLTDLDAGKVELNPAFIVMMKRDTHMPEEGVEMPFTKIYLSSGQHVWCVETPEEISNLQMQSIAKAMEALMPMFKDVMEELD
jgi:hypothetical protein